MGGIVSISHPQSWNSKPIPRRCSRPTPMLRSSLFPRGWKSTEKNVGTHMLQRHPYIYSPILQSLIHPWLRARTTKTLRHARHINLVGRSSNQGMEGAGFELDLGVSNFYIKGARSSISILYLVLGRTFNLVALLDCSLVGMRSRLN